MQVFNLHMLIPQVENLRPLPAGRRLLPATCGHAKTPPRTAPSWMPPAVRRLRYVLPVTGSSAPGAPSSRGQASFAIRFTRIWWLSPFLQTQSACDHVAGRLAVPAELPQPPGSEGSSDATHEHQVRGLGDEGDFGERGGR